jgi:hypothetical protein
MKIRAVPCEVYSRVVGYYMPVECWNLGKREEFKDRKPVDIGTQDFDREDRDDTTG